MSERKQQHYIPQFYLRNFSTDKRLINVFNLNRNEWFYNVSIKGQAKKPYLYGKDKIFETFLGSLENKVAPIIKQLIENGEAIKKESKEDYLLKTFITLFLGRTPKHEKLNNYLLDLAFQYKIQQDPSMRGKFGNLVLRHEEPVAFNLAVLMESAYLTFDLELKVLVNMTNEPFFCSDHPVIQANTFMSARNNIGNLGIACLGIQLLLPISDKHYLILYDPRIYSADKNYAFYIPITNKKEILSLNKAQFSNSDCSIYSMENLKNKHMNDFLRRKKRCGIKNESKLKGYRKLIMKGKTLKSVSLAILDNDIKFSSIKETTESKEIKNILPKKTYPRSEEILKEVQFLKSGFLERMVK
jgi:hypothetical protein